MKRDKEHQEQEFPDENLILSDHDEIGKPSEDMATAMAIISFEDCEDKSPIVLIGPEGKKLTWEQWVERYPNRYNYYHEVIHNLTINDFNK